jgi:hypothetical protein
LKKLFVLLAVLLLAVPASAGVVTSVTLTPGHSVTVSIQDKDADGVTFPCSGPVTATSTNAGIASITPGGGCDFVVNGVSLGTATIHVADGSGATSDLAVTVTHGSAVALVFSIP